MEFSKNVDFARIFRNKEIKKELIDKIKTAYILNKNFFGKTPKKIHVVFCDNEKDFRKEAKYYYQKWITATVLRSGTLVARSPEFVEKKGRWSKKDYQAIMNHEMNHVFWNSLYYSSKPAWLLEGMACHVGNNFILTGKDLSNFLRKVKISHLILDYRYMKRNFSKGHAQRYPAWANFTRYIANKHSSKKLTELMEEYARNKTRQNYERKFRELFGKDERQLFGEFLKASI